MSLLRRALAVSAAIAATAAFTLAPAQATPPLKCRVNTAANAYFTITVERGLMSCNVTEVGIIGHTLPDGAADLSVWGPDNFRHLTHAESGVYKTVWRGDHAPGSDWCASFVGYAAALCLLA
ncbi:hypothetical protein [Kutzneria chonburiensis]|uniref:Secreted protein n=1 Tax=Kutzneria chonburiensis TaxID=1483604 RepID=A0ABV6MYZ4_9PSEU|nr:hypothetical protein [Kutzneria chonburiensis]